MTNLLFLQHICFSQYLHCINVTCILLLNKTDLYQERELKSVFSASEIHWKAPSCQAWKSSLVEYLKAYLNMLNIEKRIILHHVQH